MQAQKGGQMDRKAAGPWRQADDLELRPARAVGARIQRLASRRIPSAIHMRNWVW